MVASRECTARRVLLLTETFLEADGVRTLGPIAEAIFGFLGGMASIRPIPLAFSTTFGSSTLPRANGHGWAEAALYPVPARANPECMARWVLLLLETFPEADSVRAVGSIAAAISGFLGDMA